MQTPEQLINLRSTYVLRGQFKTQFTIASTSYRFALYRDASARLHHRPGYRYSAAVHTHLRHANEGIAGGASKALAGAIAEGLIPGPRLIQCGKALSQTGMYVQSQHYIITTRSHSVKGATLTSDLPEAARAAVRGTRSPSAVPPTASRRCSRRPERSSRAARTS